MGMAAPIYYTADMVRAMPEDRNRYEVVYGELVVTPAPRPWHEIIQHQSARSWAGMPTSPGDRTCWLVAEILSPASARYDRFLKRRRYPEAGVPLYWIVEGTSGRWRSGRRLTPSPASSGSGSCGTRRRQPSRSLSVSPSCSGRSEPAARVGGERRR
jgi:hypothetical protein